MCLFNNLICPVCPVVDVVKLFLEEIYISPKFRIEKKFVLMSEPALKYESYFMQNYNLRLFFLCKWTNGAVSA